VPDAQVALKAELSPAHIGETDDTAVGAVGVAVTVTVTGSAGLLHAPDTHDA
jgi:hypothetical protein